MMALIIIIKEIRINPRSRAPSAIPARSQLAQGVLSSHYVYIYIYIYIYMGFSTLLVQLNVIVRFCLLNGTIWGVTLVSPP